MIVERILARRLGMSIAPERGCRAALEPVLRMGGETEALWLWIEAGGVLYDDTCWWRWLAQLLSHLDVHTRYETLLEIWESEFARGGGSDDCGEALRRCLEQLGVPKGCRDEIQAAANARQKQLEHSLLPFQGVATALAELADTGVPLVALAGAGCPAWRLVERLQSLALADPFQRFMSAQDQRRSLTQPSFYRESLHHLELQPQHVVLVTNKVCHLAAASEAGLATIAVDCPQYLHADIHLDLFATLRCELRHRTSRKLAA